MGVEQTDPDIPADAVGRRVSCDGERATVRYVGPVPPTSGLWLGVEWDNPERGKHDGSRDQVQYFTCRHPTGGSFVRPAKVSFGVDYLTAMHQAYKDEAEKMQRNATCPVFAWTFLERSYHDLQSVLLTRSEVNGPGADGEIRKTTPNVTCLDLAGTLLSSWDDVAAITRQLEKLERLELSRNRLTFPADVSALCSAFSNLRELSLHSCELTWTQILECAPMWPKLEELCLDENNITELQRPDGVLQTLRSLSLSSNPLVQESVLSIAALPRLEQLNLSRTGLSALRFDDAALGAQTQMFPALRTLRLDHNNITEWCVVDELAKLRALVKLSCRGNRLTSSDGNPRTANQMLIAKLGRLLVLNSCEIKQDERRGAELDYLKAFGAEWLKTGGGSQFTRQHPRYLSLIDKYGPPDEGELKKPESSALNNQLMKITFEFPDAAERKPIQRKLPASMVVLKVKGLLYRLLKVPAADLRLSYTTLKAAGREFEMDNDLKTLQFYSIEDGDHVLVRWS